jgi:hypothetical protein
MCGCGDCSKTTRNGGSRPSLDRTEDHELDSDTAADSASQEVFASRLCLSAFTSVLEAIGDWRDDIAAKLPRIDRRDELEDEVRSFSRLCFTLGEFLSRGKLA